MALRDLASPLLQTHPSADDRDAALKRALANAGHAGAIPPKRRTDAFRKLATTGRFARLLALYRLTHGALVAARDGDGAKADRLLREALPKAIDATPDMRLMLYAALRAQPGRADEAYRLLASTPPQAPGSLDFYRVLAMEHIERGAFAEAGRVLDRGDQVLSAPTGLLTARITLARMQNDAARLQSALARCQASGDAALVKLCGAAATGVDPEAEFKAGGGLLAAFGTGGATGTPGGGGGILNSVLSGAGSAAGGVGAVLGSIFKQ
jgi:hypothetical protein